MKQLATHTLEQIIFSENDNEILQLIKNLENQASKSTDKKLGINFLSDVILFTAPYKQSNLLGISCNLTDVKQFEKAMHEQLNAQQCYLIKEDVGIVFTYLSDATHEKTTAQDLQEFVSKKLNFKKSNLLQAGKQKKMVEIKSLKPFFDKNSTIHSSNFAFEILKNEITLTGDINLNATLLQKGTFIKKNKNSFHISSLLFPKDIRDSITSKLQKLNIDFPKLQSISLNYNGLEFGNVNNEMAILPDIDAVLTMDSSWSVDTYLAKNLSLINPNFKFENNILKIGDYNYFVKQIDPRTVFIGKQSNSAFESQNGSKIISISGSLKKFLSIKNGGFILSMLEMSPEFKSAKSFINSTKDLNITCIKKGERKLKFDASLQFKDEQSAAIQLILLLLNSGALEN